MDTKICTQCQEEKPLQNLWLTSRESSLLECLGATMEKAVGG